MLNRVNAMTQYDVPKIAIIYGGTNDPGNSISTATTTSNLQSMAQMMLNAGAKVIICLQHYDNFSANGDTTATPSGSTGTTWNAQKQAYTNLVGANSGKIALCDFYGYMRNLIDTGKEVQGDWASWHVADQNVHLSAKGELYLAQALLQTIQAQNGWIDLLK
jgi:lysophospholipase L1-like esterase